MKFEQALAQFQHELMKEYGPEADKCLVKIGLTYGFFDLLMIETHKKRPYFSEVRPSDISDCTYMGIRLLAVREDGFQ